MNISAPFMLFFHLLLLGLVCGGWWLVRRGVRWPRLLIAGLAALLLALLAVVASPSDSFGKIQLLAWLVFLHLPLFGLGAAWLLRPRRLAWLLAGSALLLSAVAAWAFAIEPRWLEISHLSLHSAKLSQPLRIVVIADLQTDAPGAYEARALRAALAQKPDLILMPGDYLQLPTRSEYEQALAELNAMLLALDFRAPLGVIATGGNVDRSGLWPAIFSGLPVTTLESSQTLDLGPLVLSGLTLQDSYDTQARIAAQDKFHIVLGHVPNFSLGMVQADLLIAGHTHGGQVRLPFIGPLLTLSAVPRAWAAGVTQLAPGKTLVVSRGVGMERDQAPRLRFLCRPEIVVIDLLPLSP